MLADHFEKVTAIDVSKEALAVAARYNCATKNVRFLHSDLQSLDTDGQYDVIFCAEVLYYIAEEDVEVVCRLLDRYLSDRGIVLLATGVPREQSDSFYFDGWADIFAAHFKQTFKEIVQDPVRPYLVAAFSRRA
jgi:2-polyprenyl-3-methyl-5-hydroxy-6-metoxy-1,4-benzoquinol methylase